MKVRELIGLLAQQDPDAEVEVVSAYGEGCWLRVVIQPPSGRFIGEHVELFGWRVTAATWYWLGFITLPVLALLSGLVLIAWDKTMARTIGASGCYACEATAPPHPFPSWDIGDRRNAAWLIERFRHDHWTARRIEHRLYVAEHKARWGW